MELLKKFCETSGVAGAESDIAEVIVQALKPFAVNVTRDSLGGVRGCIRAPKEGEPHLLLQAHMDEIGMIVTHIEERGFLRVAACGGLDTRLLPAKEVCVHGKEDLFGVITSVPPHIKALSDKKELKIDDLFVDTGLSTEQVKECIAPGDMISFGGDVLPLCGTQVSSKALDDRAGVASIFAALQALQNQDYACGLTVLFSPQEEVGNRGAAVGAYGVDYDVAICVDVSFGLADGTPTYKSGKLGGGPMIGYASMLDRRISQALQKAAMQENIPSQVEVMGANTSTDADAIGIVQKGIPTGLCSIPLRYMHTPVETVDVDDIENTGKLLAAFVKRWNTEEGATC